MSASLSVALQAVSDFMACVRPEGTPLDPARMPAILSPFKKPLQDTSSVAPSFSSDSLEDRIVEAQKRIQVTLAGCKEAKAQVELAVENNGKMAELERGLAETMQELQEDFQSKQGDLQMQLFAMSAFGTGEKWGDEDEEEIVK